MQGSPPRMRGKVPNTCVTTTCCGITPAYAGKSYTRTCYAYNVRDHPRVCGEKCQSGAHQPVQLGSPPRMRGKAANFGSTGRAAGITPAYAGKRVTIFWKGAWGRDHPRVCGEKRVPPLIGLLCTGSPPRMRGKVHRKRRRTCTMRITPAYAGKRVHNSYL